MAAQNHEGVLKRVAAFIEGPGPQLPKVQLHPNPTWETSELTAHSLQSLGEGVHSQQLLHEAGDFPIAAKLGYISIL